MPWTRRHLLFAAGGTTLAVALGIGGLALQPTVRVEPQAPLRALDERAYSILTAVADALCPGVEGAPTTDALDVAGQVDRFLSTCAPALTDEVTSALLFVENAVPSMLLDAHPRRPLTACSREERLQVLEAFRDSRITLRQTVFKALLGLVTATYFGDERVHAFVGYVPLDFSGTP